MPTGRITNRSVEAAKPLERDSYLWDSELAGFGLKVTKTGTRVYLVQYRVGGRDGRTRRVTIGRHGSPWTPHTARVEAKQILGKVAAREDPAEVRTKERRDITISKLCDLYLEEGVAKKKPSTLAVDRGRIKRHIKPLLGRRLVRDIERGDVERFMQAVASGRTAQDIKTGPRGRAIVKGGPGTANKAVALLGAIFAFAIRRGDRTDNPAHGIEKYSEGKNERFLSSAELGRLGDILGEAEREGINPTAISAIRLLVLTGCRKSEVLDLRWDCVDFERACLRLEDSKTGKKVIQIGAPAIALLSSLERLADNPYVFPSSAGGHFVGLQKIWERLRAKADLQDVRLHDLRHTHASVGAASGLSLLMIGKMLGHKYPETTQRYAHLADDPVREAVETVASRIAAAMTSGNGANVVKLRHND